ncbi:hypothetical protein [Oceaniglobus ichthyenteri]|uniref:hypothetical protein n=1 Tax=Oceaniglobus ichthyenteri TaxID=2136177 RepID=UPI000D339E37|nr:hypothetical protein [Oceaniglobus ichthyenteri]
MDVAFHLGAHCTDSERLLRSLLRNREPLSDLGVSVPGPGRYRDVLRDVMTKLRGDVASQDTRDVVLETVLERDEPDRLILSNPNFISRPVMSLQGDQLYPKAFKVAWLRNIFPDSPVALYLAVRNPATFVPALLGLLKDDNADRAALLSGLNPLALRWSRTVADIQAACPDCPITVWCHEDSPLLWGEIMRTLAGVGEDAGLYGGFDLVREIIQPEGLKKLRAYTKAHPPANDGIRRKIVGAFLDKFAIEDEIDDVLDVPGWTPDLVSQMTEAYEHDLDVIEAMPGVRLLIP